MMKRRDFFHHWFNWYALLTPIWVGIIFFNEFVTWRNWGPQDWAAWVGAIGTLAAFAGTIYLARTETRRREHIELGRLALAGFEHLTEIARCARQASWISQGLRQALLARQIIPACDVLARRLHTLKTWDEEALLPFLILDGHIGLRMRLARSEIATAATILLTYIDKHEENVALFYEQYEDVIDEACNNLECATQRFRKVEAELKEYLPRI